MIAFRFPLIILSFLFWSCNYNRPRKETKSSEPDSNQRIVNKYESEILANSGESAADETKDSLQLDSILKDALKISESTLGKHKFEIEYDTTTKGYIPVKVKIIFSNMFTSSNQHLMIERETPGFKYFDIYTQDSKGLIKVLSHQQWMITYENDTIWDVNGDGFRDFVVNWYGSSGCCLKAFSNVYLLRNDLKSFSRNFEFINPTFSPTEKIIRGVDYGQPGETDMYKYKWNGEQVDTVEYIYFGQDSSGYHKNKIYVSTKEPRDDNPKTSHRIDKIPIEYAKIFGYNWFMGDW